MKKVFQKVLEKSADHKKPYGIKAGIKVAEVLAQIKIDNNLIKKMTIEMIKN